ncbi:hypothetical protein Scep_024234 [Stephania cephalantha]|uniref:Uncharacterized protein n=1 Tax=Stephania cephalantha TaxID=152367 RepID=A0AAP0EWT7_9MAGN
MKCMNLMYLAQYLNSYTLHMMYMTPYMLSGAFPCLNHYLSSSSLIPFILLELEFVTFGFH